MALINTGSDSWLLEYNACESLSRDIMAQLHARDKELPGSLPYDSLSGKIRIRLKQYGSEIGQLKSKLQLPSIISSLTSDERERRLRQVDQLQSRFLQLEAQFGRSTGQGTSRSSNVVVDMATTGWADDSDHNPIQQRQETHHTQPVSDLRAQQEQMLRAQDEGLEGLSQIIARQKKIAHVITEEVDNQDEMLDDIANNMDRVDTRVVGETDMIRTITRKDNTCWYWVTIVILLIVILAVAFA